MAERRTLSQRVHSPVHTNPEAVRAFVTQEPQATPIAGPPSLPTPLPTTNNTCPVGLIPITVRLSPEIAGALKRISLERQLARADYFSQQEIVERALKAWLQQKLGIDRVSQPPMSSCTIDPGHTPIWNGNE